MRRRLGQAPVIDLTDYGIFKCLGKGQLPKQPVVVKARYISKLAEKKIKEVGGACHHSPRERSKNERRRGWRHAGAR